jgi:preprotein translocase subunit SecG
MNKTIFLQKFTACLMAGLILVAICLVLGRAFPPSWVIPEIVFGLAGFFLITSLIYPFIWQRKENLQTANSSKVLAFWQGIIRYGLAFDIAHFGWKKVFLQQFITPYALYEEKLGSLSGEWLTWNYFGFSYGFGLIVASVQIGGYPFTIP